MQSHPIWYSIPAWIIAASAVIGNILVIVLIATRKRLRRSANWFVLSLAVADVCVGIVAFPVQFLCEYGPPCEELPVVYIALWTSLYASILSLCVMITDRYLAVVWALKYSVLMPEKHMKLAILLAWLFSLSFSLVGHWATRSQAAAKIYYVFAIIVLYILPSLVLTAFTAHMFVMSRKHSKKIRLIMVQLNYNQLCAAPRIKYKTRAMELVSTKLTGALVTIFNVAYFGYACCTICHHLEKCELPTIIFYVKPLLLLINSALNPLVYSLLKRDIRKELKCIIAGV